MRSVVFSRTAQKQLCGVDKQARQRILQKIEEYATNRVALANQIKKLSGSAYFRLRVGDYRVLFDEDDKVVLIVKVAHRRDVYR